MDIQKPVCVTPGRPYIVGENPKEKKAFAFIPGCGKWECPACKQKLQAEWVFVALSGAQKLLAEGWPLAFITLTARGGTRRTRDTSIADFAVGWPKLNRRAKYQNGGNFEYFLIPELHKNSVVHYHLIATDQQSKRWWKDNSYAVGLGYMADAKRLQDVGWVVWYTSKYLGKDLGGVSWPEGLRRVRTSRGWPRPPDLKPPNGWEYSVFRQVGALMWEIHLLQDYGYSVTLSKELREAVTKS